MLIKPGAVPCIVHCSFFKGGLGMRRTEMEQIRVARTCYGHLAGWLGVSVTEALVAEGLLEQVDNEYRISAKG